MLRCQARGAPPAGLWGGIPSEAYAESRDGAQHGFLNSSGQEVFIGLRHGATRCSTTRTRSRINRMPRPTRVHVNGALYYVTSRSLEQTPLFKDRKDYTTYLEFLEEYRAQFGCKLFAFALLPDALHLCLELTNETTISTIMHALSTRYTKYYKKRYGYTGHLFQKRFKATVIEKTPYLLRLTGFIHTLPERSGVAAESEVSPWTSYQYYRCADPAEIVPSFREPVREVQESLCRQHPAQTYEQYVSAIPERDWQQLAHDLTQHVLGSASFIELTKQQRTAEPARPAPQPQPLPSGPRAHRRLSPAVAVSVAVASVAVCAAALSATNLSSLKQTVQALAQELELTTAMSEEGSGPGLVTFEPAVHRQSTGFIRSSGLNGTIWDVEMRPTSASADASVVTDQLRFERNMMISSRMSEQGFTPSTYALRFRKGGMPVWEATQVGRGGDVIRWRGAWDGETMKGVMTRQIPGSRAMSFSFVGTPEPASQSRREI